MPTKRERIEELFRRLASLPHPASADVALVQISVTLDQVEDQLSGIAKKVPPPPLAMDDGRMYAPQDDCITRHPDGRITAITRGHIIEIEADGSMTFHHRKTGATEFTK
jgi:hypothetical protein